MKIDILSLFPEMFAGPLHQSIVGKALEKELLQVDITNYRDFTESRQHHVDDYPYGGGAGMLLQAQRFLLHLIKCSKTAVILAV